MKGEFEDTQFEGQTTQWIRCSCFL